MHSLEPELETLRPIFGSPVVDPLIARERREVFSVYPELRICGWLGATLLATAAGLVVKNNLERIGPLALAIAMAVAAAACYTFVAWRRERASLIDDYVLLLGALLVSADVAFIESQFHLFDSEWRHHLLLLAFIHAAGAYSYGSRVLLSLSITALASWIGAHPWMQSPGDYAGPGFAFAVVLLAWRAVHRRVLPPTVNRQPPTDFSRTFEHFAATSALLGAFALMIEKQIPGALALFGIGVAVIVWGFRTRSEPFVLYGFIAVVIAVDVLIIEGLLDSMAAEAAAVFVVVLSIIGAIIGLILLHARFKRMSA
jgi:hypothetical protein